MKPLLVLILAAALGVSCGGGVAGSPSGPTPFPGNAPQGQRQVSPYDTHEPGVDSGAPTPAPIPPDPASAPTFDGAYAGSADGSDVLTLTVSNGAVSFTIGTDVVPGTVSASGAVRATGGSCDATLTGQITLTAAAVASASGTWSHPTGPACGTANSGAWTATRTTDAPAPTPAPGALSGTWTGTVTATIGTGNPRTPNNVSFVFDHSSDSLTGIMSPSPAIAGLTARLDLTGAFTGNLTIVFEGKTAVFPGSMQVDTGANTMTGTFSGINTDGLPERNVFALRRKQ